MTDLFLPAMVGFILGFLASKMLFLQWLTLIPWAVAAGVLGYLSQMSKKAIIHGLVYGFFLGFIFILVAYNGSDPVITKVPFFAVLGFVSAVCGSALGILGFLIKKGLKQN